MGSHDQPIPPSSMPFDGLPHLVLTPLAPFFILDDDEGITQSCRQRGAKALLDVPANVIPTLELNRVPLRGRGSTSIRQRRAHVRQPGHAGLKARSSGGRVSRAETPWPPFFFFPSESFRCSKEARACWILVGWSGTPALPWWDTVKLQAREGAIIRPSHQASGEFQAFHFFFSSSQDL